MNKNLCPMCMGSKEVFDGEHIKSCNLCDEHGNVTDELKELLEPSEEFI